MTSFQRDVILAIFFVVLATSCKGTNPGTVEPSPLQTKNSQVEHDNTTVDQPEAPPAASKPPVMSAPAESKPNSKLIELVDKNGDGTAEIELAGGHTGIHQFSGLSDLDGDGTPEAITIDKGRLTVGTTSIEIDGKWVVLGDLDVSKPGKQLLLFEDQGEDARKITLYIYRKDALAKAGTVSGEGMRLEGKLVKERYGNCGQSWEKHWALRNDKLVKIYDKTKGKYNPQECAACPYVYVHSGSGWFFVGEVLRNLHSPSLESTQALELPLTAVKNGRVRVRIAERKPEITHLDDVYLDVDGQHVLPTQCAQRTLFCGMDNQRLSLSKGESIELDFVLPEGAPPKTLHLWAKGYYVPIRL